jgi:4-oxalocrotonate tautomerase
MPFIEAHIAAGLSCARKRQLIRDIVQVAHEAIGSDPKIINVVIHERLRQTPIAVIRGT